MRARAEVLAAHDAHRQEIYPADVYIWKRFKQSSELIYKNRRSEKRPAASAAGLNHLF